MTDTIVFIDAENVATDLTTAEIGVMQGVSGRGLPPVKVIEEEIPEQPGSRFRQALFRPREMDIPLVFRYPDSTDLRTALRTFLPRLDPTRGEGTLRVTSPDSSMREVSCRYVGGMEMVENDVRGMQRGLLIFRAFEPFWQDTVDTSEGFSVSAPVNFFPFFPLRLSEDSISTGVQVTNSGDVEAWPVWTINGPGENIVLTNDSSGESLTLATTLLTGESVTIDTRPGIKTVTKSDGTNLYADLVATSKLWALGRGTNDVSVQMTGADSSSTVELRYRRRYLTV